MNLISMDKKYKTRDGRDVRILCIDADTLGSFKVVAIIDSDTGVETYTPTGRCHNDVDDSCLDLIEQPEEKTVWLEIYRFAGWDSTESDGKTFHKSVEELNASIEESKEAYSDYRLVAIKKITYVAGEGV